MKANELMIGDWVSIDEPDRYAGATGQILSLFSHNEDEGAYFTVFIQGKYGFLHKEVCNMDIRPIPLTSEILEKNGIKYQFGMPWYQGGYDELGYEVHFDEHCQIPITYVHELQHALKLFGIKKEIKL